MSRKSQCGRRGRRFAFTVRSGLAGLLLAPLAFALAGCDAPKMSKAPPPKDEQKAATEYSGGVPDEFAKPKPGEGRGGSSGRWDAAPQTETPAPPPPATVGQPAPRPSPPPPSGGAAPPAREHADAKTAGGAPPQVRTRQFSPPRQPAPGAGAPAGSGSSAPAGSGGPSGSGGPTLGAPAPAPSAVPPSPDAGVTKPGTAVIDENSDWDLVPVFFGTDRARTSDTKRIAYGSDRSRKLELGRALVTVPKTHEVPNIERPWALKVPYFEVKVYEQAEDPKKHFTMKEIQALTREQFLAFVKERLATSTRYKDHAVIFVHGYNTSFDAAIYRTAQMAYDLGFDGAPFLYSWPSGGTFESYTYDRESAGQSQPFMRDFLDMVVKQTGAKSVSIIAHSMGNQPVLQILRDLRFTKPDGVVINQIILAAPDVDRDNFENIAQEIKGMARGVTLYAAGNDRALNVSRRFNGGIPRAGDVPQAGPLVLSGIDTIDVTAAGMEGLYLNHSGYAENKALLSDIGLIIQTGERPPDKRFPLLQKITTSHGEYWKFPPKR